MNIFLDAKEIKYGECQNTINNEACAFEGVIDIEAGKFSPQDHEEIRHDDASGLVIPGYPEVNSAQGLKISWRQGQHEQLVRSQAAKFNH